MGDAPDQEVRRVSYLCAKSALYVLCENNKPLENQSIIKGLWCPEQDSNLHASQHSHLKRARLPFRHLGIASAKVIRIFEFAK